MKTKTKYVSLVVAAAISGVAFFALSETSFSAFFQSDLAIAGITAVAITGLAFRDYSRRAPALAVRATIVRPSLRLTEADTAKTTAYSAKSGRTERLAA